MRHAISVLRGLRNGYWLLPIAGALLFFVITAIHYAALIDVPVALEPVRLGDPVSVRREAWKDIWIGGSMALCVAAIGSIIHSTYVLLQLRLTKLAGSLLLLAAIAWFGLAFGLWFKGGTGIAFGMTGGYAVKVLEGLKSSAVQQRVAAALIVNSSAGFIAMIFIVGGLCGLMHPKESDRIELVAERVQHFHSLLYLSVGLTLTGLWMIFGLFHWAAALAGAAETKNAIVIADSVVLLAGMFYSVILVITFIPASIALQGMIDKAFRVRLTEPNPPKYSEWREAVGLSDIPLASVRTYLSLGAPMVSGLFAAFVKNLVA